jgi:peroxiredoxin
MLKVGTTAPLFELPSITGDSVSLSQQIQDNNSVLLIFLRHLG